MKPQSFRSTLAKGVRIIILLIIIASSYLVFRPRSTFAAPRAIQTSEQFLSSDMTVEAGTPLQNTLKKHIQELKAQNLPVPDSVTYEYNVVAVPTQNNANSATIETVTVTGTTVLAFDNPRQAGYEKWPDWIIEDTLPAGAVGSILPGDYNQSVREVIDQAFPGYWKKHEFGYEPRIYVLDETYEIVPQDAMQAESLAAMVETQSSIDAEVLLGFTVPGPRINYLFNPKWQVCAWNYCVTLAEAKAGLALDWAFGLRVPGRVRLMTPDSLVAGQPYMLSSSFTTLNWNEEDYLRFGVHPGNGKEFAWYFDFFLGVRLIVAGRTVINWAIDANFDYSKDCSIPVGNGACAIPLQTRDVLTPEQTGLKWVIPNFATIGIGLIQEPAISSKMVTADWETRQGDYISTSGQLSYSGLGMDTSFGLVEAQEIEPMEMQIRLSRFRYYFNNFVLSYSGSFQINLLGHQLSPILFHIYTFDLYTLSGGLLPSVGIHDGTTGVVTGTVPVTPGLPKYPTTTIALTGTPGTNNWYRSDVQVVMTAAVGSGSGLVTFYSYDNATWSQYTSPVTLSTDGVTTLYYFSSDSKGTEPVHTQLIKIDKTPPAISIVSPQVMKYTHMDLLGLDWTVSENNSGIATQFATFDGGPVANSQVIDLFYLDLGLHRLVVETTDEAGNSADAFVPFYVVADIHSLIATMQRAHELGWIEEEGIVKSLDAKLKAAKAAIERGQFIIARNQLEAFLNELNAQKNKALNQQVYELLEMDVLYVISRLP